MATLVKRKDRDGKWRVNYIDTDGKRYQIDTGTTDRKVAEVWLRKVQDLLSQARIGIIEKVGRIDVGVIAGKKPEHKSNFTLEEFRKKYEQRCKQDLELAKKTIEANNHAFVSLINIIGNKFLDKITDEDIITWKTAMLEKGYSRTTVGIYSRHLKAGFSRAVKWEMIISNPFDKVESIKQAPERASSKISKAMTVEEIRTLLHAIDEMQDYDFGNYIRALLYTGARRNEILMLRWEDIDLKNQKMRIYQEKTKKELEIPINSALMKVFQKMGIKESGFVFQSKSRSKGAFKKDQTWHKDFVTHRFKSYVEALKLPGHYTLHSLRHTFTNRLLEQGVPREFVHKLLGHSSERTTAEHYDHTLALHFRNQAELVTFEE